MKTLGLCLSPSLSALQALDGRIYEHVKDYLVALCHTELEASQATHNTFQFLLDKSTRVSQLASKYCNVLLV